MSLFPAYSNANNDQGPGEESKEATATSWLTNSSFTNSLAGIKPKSDVDSCSDSSDVGSVETPLPASLDTATQPSQRDADGTRSHRKRKKERAKSKKTKKRDKAEVVPAPAPPVEDLPYLVDTARDLGYLKMDRQSKRARPRYEMANQSMAGVYAAKLKLKTRKKPIRYFSKKTLLSGMDNEAAGEELKKAVESLNKAVHEDPSHLDNWLKLVDFQEDYFKFQAIQFKTSGDRDRAVSQQRLAILERAMAANPGQEALQKLWLSLASDCCPADEVESRLDGLVREQGESVMLCLGRAMLTQQSMPRCTAPAVLTLYKQGLERLQRSRHLASAEQDNATLEVLLHACVFLEQSGLWEAAWTALKLTLSLNLSLEVADVSASEQALLDQENAIFEGSEGKPLWHLWTGLETLRQGHHFLPVRASENFPQRVVAAEDVVQLVHHVRRGSHFRLLVLLPLLANVPLLPRSHALIAAILSQRTHWALDSVEWHLAATFTHLPMMEVMSAHLGRHVPESMPPQYLRALPGQAEFLAHAVGVFEGALSGCSGRARVAIGVWYLRFLRWLDEMTRIGRYKPPPGRTPTKAVYKHFLQREENRDSVLFYVEYGLWQYEAGVSDGTKTLETLTLSRGSVLDQSDQGSKTDLCALYRALCQMQISMGSRASARTTLRRLCRASSDTAALSILRHVATEASLEPVAEELEDLMLPNFTVDWISCYALALALAGSVQDSQAVLTDAIAATTVAYVKERLHETGIAITRSFCNQKPQSELPAAVALLAEFPLNALAANVIAEGLVVGGGLWWKDMTYLLSAPGGMAAVAAVGAVMERARRHGAGGQDHRGLALLRRLAAQPRTSVLVHRMHVRLLAETGNLQALERARVMALEAWPWSKSLYMEAISASPTELLPLTDVLVEKDLRIHITPDEIQAMRD